MNKYKEIRHHMTRSSHFNHETHEASFIYPPPFHASMDSFKNPGYRKREHDKDKRSSLPCSGGGGVSNIVAWWPGMEASTGPNVRRCNRGS
jgi:hypothetical protein